MYYEGKQQMMFQDPPMDTYSVKLASWHARMARRRGDGNLSRGIRLVIEEVMSSEEWREKHKDNL
jgi:hypothetical protein